MRVIIFNIQDYSRKRAFDFDDIDEEPKIVPPAPPSTPEPKKKS